MAHTTPLSGPDPSSSPSLHPSPSPSLSLSHSLSLSLSHSHSHDPKTLAETPRGEAQPAATQAHPAATQAHPAATEAPPLETPEVVTPQRRIASLDVIRGVAIIGTLASNIWLFQAFAGDRIINEWWEGLASWAVEGKFLGLLTIMFGIGLAIQRQAALRRGSRWPGTYLIRTGLLFLDGVLNYIFVVQFDVLRAYAILGFIVAFILLLPEKRQWLFITVALATHFAFLLAPDALMPGGIVFPGEFPVFEGRPTYWQEVHMNALTVLSDITIGSDTGSILTLGLVVFVLGAVLYRNGIFDERGARLRKWTMAIGFGVGLPLDITFFLTSESAGLGRFIAAPLVAFGILALMASFYQRRRVGFVGRRFAIVGQMALSCYVLQNILGRVAQTVILNSPLVSMIDPLIGTLAMFLLIAIAVIILAEFWMRHFRKGPLEYIWDVSFRAITRKKSPVSVGVGVGDSIGSSSAVSNSLPERRR